jgi:hypothetical protein
MNKHTSDQDFILRLHPVLWTVAIIKLLIRKKIFMVFITLLSYNRKKKSFATRTGHAPIDAGISLQERRAGRLVLGY